MNFIGFRGVIMAKKHKFYFRIVGNNEESSIMPNSLKAKDLAEVITIIDGIISAQLADKTGSDITSFHIVQISKGSLMLSAKCDTMTEKAIISLANDLNSNTLSSKVKKNYDKLKQWTAISDSRCEFLKTPKGVPLATVKGQIATQQEQKTVNTTTTIYGKIVGLSGTGIITCEISPMGCYKGKITFHVSDEDAKKLGAKYNEIVSVYGDLEIQLPERNIISFTLSSINYDYEDIPIADAVKEMREKFGKYFADIKDPVQFVRSLRG